jgi:Na+/alanine symporter
MALPNLIALALLSPVVFKLTQAWFRNQNNESS